MAGIVNAKKLESGPFLIPERRLNLTSYRRDKATSDILWNPLRDLRALSGYPSSPLEFALPVSDSGRCLKRCALL